MRFMRLLLIFVSIFSLQVISYPPGVRISFHDSYDRSQPDPADEGALRCLDVGYKKDVECYDAKFVSMSFHRAVIDFTEKERSHYEQWLPVMLQDISSNATVNEMELMFSGIGDIVTDVEDVFFDWLGNALDVFLMPHPSWSVQQEPYVWQKTWQISDSTFNHSSRSSSSSSSSSSSRHSSGSVAGDGSLRSHTDSPLKVVLRRYRYDFEPYFQLLTDLQFPATQEKCANRTLVVDPSRCGTPGWGGVLEMHYGAKSSTFYSVHTMYSTRSNDVNESTAFIQGSDCPNERNKWLCAFLPMTNCTLPRLITDCREKNCVDSLRHTVGLSVMFDKAAVDGQEIDGTNREVRAPATRPNSHFERELHTYVKKNIKYKYIRPAIQHLQWFNRMTTHNDADLFTYYFMLRQNAFYRQRVAEMIAHFREEMNFPSSKRCVAVHIRRGDRIRGGFMNITEMCRKYRVNAGDMGCFGVPFALITMKDVIEAIKHIVNYADPSIRNIMVATDDMPWLIEQRMEVASFAPEWNIYYMDMSEDVSLLQSDNGRSGFYKGYWTMRWGGTESGVYLFSQMKVLQQCEAFAGHMQSAMTRMFYRTMCISHASGRYQGFCPPAYDLGEITHLKTNITPKSFHDQHHHRHLRQRHR